MMSPIQEMARAAAGAKASRRRRCAASDAVLFFMLFRLSFLATLLNLHAKAQGKALQTVRAAVCFSDGSIKVCSFCAYIAVAETNMELVDVALLLALPIGEKRFLYSRLSKF